MAYLEIETTLPAEAGRYRRSLDLDEAIARVEFAAGDMNVPSRGIRLTPGGSHRCSADVKQAGRALLQHCIWRTKAAGRDYCRGGKFDPQWKCLGEFA